MSRNQRSEPSESGTVVELVFQLKSLVTEISAMLAEAYRPLGLTCVQADALLALADHGPLTLKDLANHLCAESGHPSRLMSRMEQLGWVARQRDPADGRAVLLTLTPAGRRLAGRGRQTREGLVANFAGSEAELAAALSVVEGLRALLAAKR